MRRLRDINCRAMFFFLGALMLLGGQNTVASAEEIVRINGSGSPLAMMKPLIAAYVRMHPDAKIVMEKPLGSSGAVKALIAGALDIAVSSKMLTDKEMQQGLIKKEYGKTPLAIVTARKIAVKNITTRELEDIYAGVMKKWPNGENIRIVLRPQEDIDVKILRGLSRGMDEAISKSYGYPGMLLAITDPESNAMVARTPGGIGASGMCGIIGEKLPLNVLSLNGVMPSAAALANGRYPLAKEIRFITASKISEGTKKFLQFIYSEKGRKIARQKGVLVTELN